MYRTCQESLYYLRQFQGTIYFIFDTCSFLSDLAGRDAKKLNKALNVLQRGKLPDGRRHSFAGIVPKEVMHELRGVSRSHEDERKAEQASWSLEILKGIPTLLVDNNSATVPPRKRRKNNIQTNDNSSGGTTPSVSSCTTLDKTTSQVKGMVQLPGRQSHIWGPMEKFLRSNDSRILAHALYFREEEGKEEARVGGGRVAEGFSLVDDTPKENYPTAGPCKGVENNRDNNNRLDHSKPVASTRVGRKEQEKEKKVVLVTEDQVLALKATAVYHLDTLGIEDFLKFF